MREFLAELRRHLCSWPGKPAPPMYYLLRIGDLIRFVWWCGIYNPLDDTLLHLQKWLGRGRPNSHYWTPRVGDRVTACLSGETTVIELSIRRDWCRTADGREHVMSQCCSPIETGTHVAYESGDR